jgi:hypothetical protein
MQELHLYKPIFPILKNNNNYNKVLQRLGAALVFLLMMSTRIIALVFDCGVELS